MKRKRELDIVKIKLLTIRYTEHVVDTSWCRQCADISELSCRKEEGGFPPYTLVVKYSTNAINIAAVARKNEGNHLETLSVLQIAYSIRISHEVLRYNAADVEERLI